MLRVARDQRIVVLRRDLQHPLSRPLAQVVDLDQHVLVDQPPDQVGAELRQALGVALAPGRIAGRRLGSDRRRRGEELGQHRHLERVERVRLLALALIRARRGAEVVAGLVAVEDVDEGALVAALERGAGERVVDPVRDEHAADAPALGPLEAAIDVLAGALRLVLDLAAAEEIRRLDPDHHRELAALDHVPRLARVLDDPQPAAPRPAALRVDVALEPPQPLDLRRDHLRLVTGVRLSRLDLAYRLVLDRLGNDQPLPRLPHPLQPPVIDLLVRVRVVHRPAGEGRPAVCVMGAERQPVAQQVAGDVLAAVGAVEVRVVPERLGDPEAVEAAAVDDRAAGAHLGRDVEMEIGEAAHGAVGVGALEWLSACAGRRPRGRSGSCPRAGARSGR